MREQPQLSDSPAGCLPYWTALAGRLDPLAAAGCHLILDLSALSFFDCTGLNLFLRWQRQAAAAGGVLHVVAATP